MNVRRLQRQDGSASAEVVGVVLVVAAIVAGVWAAAVPDAVGQEAERAAECLFGTECVTPQPTEPPPGDVPSDPPPSEEPADPPTRRGFRQPPTGEEPTDPPPSEEPGAGLGDELLEAVEAGDWDRVDEIVDELLANGDVEVLATVANEFTDGLAGLSGDDALGMLYALNDNQDAPHMAELMVLLADDPPASAVEALLTLERTVGGSPAWTEAELAVLAGGDGADTSGLSEGEIARLAGEVRADAWSDMFTAHPDTIEVVADLYEEGTLSGSYSVDMAAGLTDYLIDHPEALNDWVVAADGADGDAAALIHGVIQFVAEGQGSTGNTDLTMDAVIASYTTHQLDLFAAGEIDDINTFGQAIARLENAVDASDVDLEVDVWGLITDSTTAVGKSLAEEIPGVSTSLTAYDVASSNVGYEDVLSMEEVRAVADDDKGHLAHALDTLTSDYPGQEALLADLGIAPDPDTGELVIGDPDSFTVANLTADHPELAGLIEAAEDFADGYGQYRDD